MDYFAILILNILQQKRYKNLGNFMKYLMLCLFFAPICVHALNSSNVHFCRSLRSYEPVRDVGLPRGGTRYAFGHYASDVLHLPQAPWKKLSNLDDRVSSLIGPREKLAHRRRNITQQDIVNFRCNRASFIAHENQLRKPLYARQ